MDKNQTLAAKHYYLSGVVSTARTFIIESHNNLGIRVKDVQITIYYEKDNNIFNGIDSK